MASYAGNKADAQVTMYYGTVVCMMYLCDYVETFADEVEYMWKGKRWNLARIFFFLSRYVAMAQIPILFSLYSPALKGSACYAVHVSVLVITYIGEAFPVAIMLLCLYALYDSRKRYAPLLFGSFALLMLALLGTLAVFIKDMSLNLYAPACVSKHSDFGQRFMLINRLLKLAAQFVMFLFASWRAWTRFREFKTPLMRVIYKGGLYYYIGVAVLAGLDIFARFYAGHDKDPKRLKIITYLGRFGTPILANRLILSMYKHLHKGNGRGNVSTAMSGLKFAPPKNNSEGDLEKGKTTMRSSYAMSRTVVTSDLSVQKDDEYEMHSPTHASEEGGRTLVDGVPPKPSVWFDDS